MDSTPIFRIRKRPSMISPSRPYTGALRPSLRTAMRLACPSTKPTNLYGIGGGGGGPVGTGGPAGAALIGAAVSAVFEGGGAFGLNRNKSRRVDTGLGRS